MNAMVWEDRIEIPTYEVGEPDKNPLFLENRVYQGSSGRVYPYPVIDKLYDKKVNKAYQAVFLENEYLKITFLPELGGRIYRAVDKTNGYDFVYHNQVIKPALVGLLGPWISGGIEFNWPQHHRPTTFMPVNYRIRTHNDRSASVTMGETDAMYGTKSTAEFLIYPDRAYLEIKVKVNNPTPLPQTFLWWANPALAANKHTRAVFPPDVTAVYDHGKRDVSAFPIATGTYYKVDYSGGVDISRYRNIPVPTSYMACESAYDFVGGYDDRKACGMLHVADHHISPGKKQWTWGCGDFGKAWDRNLTDEDGPYVELMTGVFTDNQPDFTWLKPFEEKSFTQYFMPYKAIGTVKNATKDIMVSCDYANGAFTIGVYATLPHNNLQVCLSDGQEIVLDKTVETITPYESATLTCNYPDKPVTLVVKSSDGKTLLSYQHRKKAEDGKTHKPLEAPALPEDTASTEELYFIGTHLEQYRHPTYRPEDYYLEGLRRDKYDTRLNIAYGRLLLRKGEFEKSLQYFQNASKRITRLNGTPYHAELYYLLGLAHFYRGDLKEAYRLFRKGSWDEAWASKCAFFAALIKSILGEYRPALLHVNEALAANPRNVRALSFKTSLLRVLRLDEEREDCLNQSLAADPFDSHSKYEYFLKTGDEKYRPAGPRESLEAASGYIECGMYQAAADLLDTCAGTPMALYYAGYCKNKLGDQAGAFTCFRQAEKADSSYCFPNSMLDRIILEECLRDIPLAPMANYYLGLLLYNNGQYERSRGCFQTTTEQLPGFATAHRNLALYFYNKLEDKDTARREMNLAFRLNQKDARVLMELDQLNRKCNVPIEDRLLLLQNHMELVRSRDDLYTEYITLLNLSGNYREALSLIECHKFHPWEGGEGKISTQYVFSLFKLASLALNDRPEEALQLLERTRAFPENLGEGRLAGTKATHIDFLTGISYERLGNPERAEVFFQKAALDEFSIGEVVYYNDQPADLLLFKGLALRKLYKSDEAGSCFDRLIAYGKKHLNDPVIIDFFAVSLPDFLTFDDDLELRNRINCKYLSALGYLGKGMRAESEVIFENLLRLDAGHIGCAMYRSVPFDCSAL